MIYRFLLRLTVAHPVLYCLAAFTVFAAIYTTILRWVMGAPWDATAIFALTLSFGSMAAIPYWIIRDL